MTYVDYCLLYIVVGFVMAFIVMVVCVKANKEHKLHIGFAELIATAIIWPLVAIFYAFALIDLFAGYCEHLMFKLKRHLRKVYQNK